MLAALIVALCVQAPPKSSVLGREKPWWEKLKPGDVVHLHSIPGTAEPMIRIWTGLGEEGGPRRTEVHGALFAAAIRDRDLEAIHQTLDRSEMEASFGVSVVQIVTVVDGLGPKLAEVVPLSYVGAGGQIQKDPVPLPDLSEPYLRFRSYLMPIASLAPEGVAQHPDRDRVPVLIRKSPDLWKGKCRQEGCRHIDVLSFAEAQRAWKEKEARKERLRRRAEEESRRREADGRR